MKAFLRWLSFLPLINLSSAREVGAAIHLDSFTFDNLRKSHDLLVCFDKYIPFGGKHDRFKDMAVKTAELNLPNFLVTWVGVQDYGEQLNQDLHKRFNVDEKNFPEYKLFTRGSDEPIDYTGSKTSRKQVLKFVEDNLGLYTTGKPGQVKEFEPLAKAFMKSTDREALKEEAVQLESEFAASDTITEELKASAKAYVKSMEKIMSKGDSYPKEEIKRIDKLLDGQLSEKKKKEFSKRRNIISSFR